VEAWARAETLNGFLISNIRGETQMRHIAAIVRRHILLLISFLVFSIPLLQAEDFFFDSAGVKIHYIVEGKGEPVLLIHGFGGSIQYDWAARGIIKELSNTFQVIALDNRGHGQSDKPHDPNSYGMNMVEDPIRQLDHLKIQKAHVVGYSMGGAITLKILASHPERLRTAVLGGAGLNPPGMTEAGKKTLADSLEQGKGLGPLISALNPVGAPPPTSEEIEKVNKRFLSTNDPLALAAVVRSPSLATTEAQLRANRIPRIPVLALIGEVDPAKSGVDSFNGLMPNLKIVVIPKANHVRAPGDPEFIRNLKAFLIEHSAASSAKGSKK
jgi:pimeloyl-ACP methyl ester carboxylesterase